MQGLFNFAQDIGAALAWILPTLCYIGGASFLLGGVWGIYQRSAMSNGFLSKGFAPEMMITAGATLLSFPEFLNVGASTLGLSSTAAMGANTPVHFDANTLTTAAKAGPLAAFTAILSVFHIYFAAYGALIVYFAIVRQVGRAKGTNNSSTSMNMIMMVAGFLVMNADVIGPELLKELQLAS